MSRAEETLCIYDVDGTSTFALRAGTYHYTAFAFYGTERCRLWRLTLPLRAIDGRKGQCLHVRYEA